MSSPRRRRTSTLVECTNGSNLSVKGSTETIDQPGDHNTYLLSPSEFESAFRSGVLKSIANTMSRGGLFHRNGAGQEQFCWDIRSEPGLIKTFAKIWGTEDLLVSVDSVNISLPFSKEDMGDRDEPWPHVDQSPNRRFKHCVQGIMNLVSHWSRVSSPPIIYSIRSVLEIWSLGVN